MFFAPEVMKKSSSENPITNKVDVWSIGAILYLLIAGSILDRVTNVKKYHTVFDFSDPVWGKVSVYVREFVEGCLQVDPDKRLSLEQLAQSDLIMEYQNQTLSKHQDRTMISVESNQ